MALFMQAGRHIVSTEEGRVFYPYVRAAFDSLLDGVEAVRRTAGDKPLRVQTYVTASIRWLSRRIPQFITEHPRIKLTLSSCAVEWEFDDRHADVGLVYCPSPPDENRFHWVPLFDYVLHPVCSPDLAARLGPDPSVADLMSQPLVTIYTEEQNWHEWFESAGIDFVPEAPYVHVDTLALALEMVLAGQGVALVNGPFVDTDLAEGRLVVPVAHRKTCPGSWGLICRKELKDHPGVNTFIAWMKDHAAAL